MTDPIPTIEQVDPTTLLVDCNVRTDAALDKAFVNSIRDLGVLVPIVVVRTATGELRVRYGQRRTLGAVEAARATVPVLVAGEEDADDVARIVCQWHENEHRAGLSTADKVAAVEQLSLLGLSAGQIVRQTRSRKNDVDQALTAAGSALAKGAAERYEFLTLDQAAAVAEFDASPEIVKALIAGAKSSEGDFAHCLQRARDEREAAAERQRMLDELTAAGVTIIEQPSRTDRTIRMIGELASDDGKELTRKNHAACPGHAAFLATTWNGSVETTYACTKWQDVGHRDRYGSAHVTGPEPMDDAAKDERRRVVANNKAWRSAETVRRQWLTTFLARKTAPKGTAVYVAVETGTGSHELRRGMEGGHRIAAELLGLDRINNREAIATTAAAATDGRAQVIGLALVLGDIEESTDVHSWRNPSESVRRYFAFLAANGYTLSEVEQLAAGTTNKRRRSTTA